MYRNVRAPAAPLKPFQIYCCFSRRGVFFFLNYSSLRVDLLLCCFWRGFTFYVWKQVLPSPSQSDEGRTFMGESGALYSCPQRSEIILCYHPLLVFSYLIIITESQNQTMWFADVLQSQLSPIAVTIHHPSSSCVMWNCALTMSLSCSSRPSVFPAALVYFQSDVETGW